MRVALASCLKLPEPDVDEPLLLRALAAAGIDARVLAWDDPAAPFEASDLVILRSTWNYYDDVDAFVTWVGARPRVLNPPAVVAWNARKTYLTTLAERGVDTVPTVFALRGTNPRLDAILRERGWDEVVIKPVVSAGSFRTERFARDTLEAGQAFLDALVGDRDAMIQRWMPSVETYGERSLVWIDGELTHAIRKTPRFAGGVEQVSEAVPIADDERAFAARALAPLAGELLYGRVDLVRDAGGVLRVMELELIEPSLFFRQSPEALERFVAAIARRLGG